MPIPVFAEIGTNSYLPPHSVGMMSSSARPVFTRSGFADSLSILFIAMIIGTPAAFAWLTASFVCGFTPSSAATTMITISVTPAPLARIAVNASWPGVSINVMFLPFLFTI